MLALQIETLETKDNTVNNKHVMILPTKITNLSESICKSCLEGFQYMYTTVCGSKVMIIINHFAEYCLR